MDLLKLSPGQKTLEKKEKSVLVNPFSRFTKTTDFFTKILGLKGRGFLNDFQSRVKAHLPKPLLWEPHFCSTATAYSGTSKVGH